MSIRFGFVSTYPPTQCGIATFSHSLMNAIEETDVHSTYVARLVESGNEVSQEPQNSEVVSILVAGNPDSLSQSVRALNQMDVAVIQHEFGIYGGLDGYEVIEVLKGLRIPSIVVVHTVLTHPTWHQRVVFAQLTRSASAVVAMTKTARELLISNYFVDPAKIFVLPHGAPVFPETQIGNSPERPLILTWGLIGPGKGIETAIEAMALLRDLDPVPRYVVAGRTHPKVLERQGEAYRELLQRRIVELGLSANIELVSKYMSVGELTKLVSSAATVLLPYDSVDQMTSGVLIEAVTAGRPVIATRFPHATELLSDGVGIVVPHRNPQAIASALRSIFTDSALAHSLAKRAKEVGTDLKWSSVAVQYVALARALIRAEAAA
jgi:glycosyltransferase involved in cell wall biosynthesis